LLYYLWLSRSLLSFLVEVDRSMDEVRDDAIAVDKPK
jgi:hypothetical protein